MTLTKWFSPHKSTLFAVVSSILLLSCGTTKPPKTTEPLPTNSEVAIKVDPNITAEQLMSQALTQSNDDAVSSFIQAAELYITENKPHKALWLANQTQVLTQLPFQQYQLALIRAKSLLALAKVEKAYQALEQAKTIADPAELMLSRDYYQTLASVQARRQLPIAALDASLRAANAYSQNNDPTVDIVADSEAIWQQLSRITLATSAIGKNEPT